MSSFMTFLNTVSGVPGGVLGALGGNSGDGCTFTLSGADSSVDFPVLPPDLEISNPYNNSTVNINNLGEISWNGDIQQAARKLEFTIAHNTPGKDKVFVPLNLKLGGFIYVFYREDLTANEIEIFQGSIFYRKRASDSIRVLR